MHPPCVATARCRLAARALVWLPPSSPPPFIIHLVASLQSTHLSPVHGLTTVTLESSSVLCRNRCAVLVVLIALGAICHAQMTQQDARQAEFAKCRAVLGAVGAGSGTPSSASKGALIACWPATDSPSMHGLHAHRCQGAARVRGASPCRAGSHALVGKNMSGAVQPTDGAQYLEPTAASCAARLRDFRAHTSARTDATSPGEAGRLIAPFSAHIYR